MRLLVVVKMPYLVVKRFDVLKERYYPQGFRKIQSHITLKPPFELKGNFEDFVAAMERAVRGVSPFELIIEGVGSFHDRIIFFKPNLPGELLRLRTLVKGTIDASFKKETATRIHEPQEFVPHVAVALANKRNFSQYHSELSKVGLKARFIVDGIKVFSWGRGRWVLRREVRFG